MTTKLRYAWYGLTLRLNDEDNKVMVSSRMIPVGTSSRPSFDIVLAWVIWSTCIPFLRDE
jgi:hypothetical protein